MFSPFVLSSRQVLKSSKLSSRPLTNSKLRGNIMKAVVLLITFLPFLANAEGFKFKVKNTTKNVVTVFYKVSKKSGNFKVRSLIKLAPGDEKIKEVSVAKDDTISFYGQNAEDETSAIVRRDFSMLIRQKNEVYYVPIT